MQNDEGLAALQMQPITVDVCPCCGGQNLSWPMPSIALIGEAFRYLSQIKYGGYMDGWEKQLSLMVAQCRNCGHIWHHTRPDQEALFGMYAHGKRLKGISVSSQPSARMLSALRGLFRYCTPADGAATLLDYGSGGGRWAVAASQAGFRVTAYEPATSRSSQIGDVELVGSMKAVGGRRFDVINLEQVLEHIPDPVSDLRALKQYCHADTVLRISVPDVARLGKKLWDGFPFNGRTMHALSPYEHLHGFRQSSLQALLKKVGLEPCADWRLLFSLPRYALERWAITLGSPFGRTTVLARFRRNDIGSRL